MYLYLRRKQILDQESGTLQVAIGAGALFNQKVLPKFQAKTKKAIEALDRRRLDFGMSKEEQARKQAEKDVAMFHKMFAALGAPTKRR